MIQDSQADSMMLEELRSLDHRENVESTPPADELVRLKCIWLLEAYTPSRTRHLEAGLHALGLAQSRFGDTGLLDSDGKLRRPVWGSSASLLGWMNRPGTRSLWADTTQPLPAGVVSIGAWLVNVVPSVSIAVFRFRLDEETASEPDSILRRHFTTRIERTTRGRRYWSPFAQKQLAVETFRCDLRDRLSKWVATRAPGVFLGEELVGPIPTAELWSTVTGVPFSEALQIRGYLEAIELSQGRPWRCEDYPGVTLSESYSRDDDKRRLIFAGREADLVTTPDPSLGSTEHRVTECDGHLAAWAMLGVTQALATRIIQLRDWTIDERVGREDAAALTSVTELQQKAAQIARITPTLTREILRSCGQKSWGNWWIGDWQNATIPSRPPQELRTELRHSLLFRARVLRDTEREAREALGLTAAVLTAKAVREAAITNQKVQSRVEVLTWLMALIAAISLIGTLAK